MHNVCGNAKTCKSYNFKCKYIHGLFYYLCHLVLNLRITLVETTSLGTFFFSLTEISDQVFLTEIRFLKGIQEWKKNMFYSSHLRGLNHLLWFCGLYSFYCLRVLVNIMCTCFLFHHPQSQIASSLKEKHCLLQFIMSLCNPGKSGL